MTAVPPVTDTALFLGTRKGAWILTADADRATWSVNGPHFLGRPGLRPRPRHPRHPGRRSHPDAGALGGLKDTGTRLELKAEVVRLTHLQRAYTKLGVNDRQGLAEALGL